MDGIIGRDRLREFIDLILAALDEDLDGPALAARGCLSRYHFDRLLAAATGESPGAFRRRLLLERAAWQLRRPGTSVTRAALDAGYQSVEGFTRAFARAFGSTPARYRKTCESFRLPAPNGIHFHPPGGIAVAGPHEGSTRMDFVDRIIGHDLWFTGRLLDRAGELPPEALDRPVNSGWSWNGAGGGTTTLRDLLAAMVANKENWSAAITGRDAPADGDTDLDQLKQRFDRAGREFTALIRGIRDCGDWDSGFVDAICDPPESFTYGGMLAHVATFSTVRRTMAIQAFRQLGVDDLGIGDPIEWERQRG